MRIIATLAIGLAALAASGGLAFADQARLHETEDNGGAPRIASGTIAWTQSVDETGAAVLEGHIEVPERGLIADLSIKRNQDGSLPASHLVEISFTPGAAFQGGAIDSVPGLLAKAEPDIRGEPLSGATAKVTTNMFLIGLTDAADAEARNLELLGSEKWLDIAMVYATGERAILTLEKDKGAAKVFDAVMAAWQSVAAR